MPYAPQTPSLILLILGTLLLVACSDTESTPPGGDPLPPLCADGVQAPGWKAPTQAAVTGPAVNAMHAYQGDVLIVVSQDNVIQRFDPDTGAISTFADLGNDRGPYDLAFDQNNIFVVNYVSESVTVLDANGVVLDELHSPSFDGPSGIAVTDRALYVSNVHFLGHNQGFGPGTVTVFDRQTLQELGTLPTAATNPQFLTAHNNALFVSDTGDLGFVDGTAVARSDGALERWQETSDLLRPTVDVARLPVPTPARAATPGRPVFIDHQAFVTSATAPVVYALDLQSFTWRRGLDNPIVLYESTQDTLHHITTDGTLLYVTAFNDDLLWRVDPRCDAVFDPIPVGFSDLLEGAHVAVIFNGEYSKDLYYALSLSNALGRLQIDKQ